MSRNVSVRDIQDAISDLRVWANGDAEFDPPARKSDLIRACAEVLEALLIDAQESE